MNKATAFSFGFLIGTGLTFVVCKKVFTEAGKKAIEDSVRKQAEAEIESVKVAFKALEQERQEDPETLTKNADEALKEYQAGSNTEQILDNEPRIIKPEEFGDPNQEVISLYYYAKNEKLVYSSGGVVEHPEDLFDLEFLNRFGEYEEDMLYIRDPGEGVDYDIEYVNERYKE
jgi:hypothetical protein